MVVVVVVWWRGGSYSWGFCDGARRRCVGMDAWGGAGAGQGVVMPLPLLSWRLLMCIFAGTGLPRRGRRPAERVLLPGTGTCTAGRRRRAFAHRNLKS